ncbi:hypothetical protein BMS3Abin03_00608 [bacterium BMS3Abin03]|nr:hypothetical protein BMS3Abin03_00608 [bacterium BMS3Abin03]
MLEQKNISFYTILCNFGANPIDVNVLIESCTRIAVTHLKLIYSRIQKLLISDSLSLEDLAIDSIARLFAVSPEYNKTPIENAFHNWQPKISNEDEAIYFINKIVSNRVEQHVNKMLRNSDPFFAKILTTVEHYINKSSCKKLNHFGRICVVNENIFEITDTVINDDEFSVLPANLFLENKELFPNLFNFLSEETEHFPAIPLNSLVYKLKYLNVQSFTASEITASHLPKIEIEEIVCAGLNSTLKKLGSDYIARYKISDEDGDLFKKALTDIAEDLKNGGVSPGLYKYLQKHSEELSKEDYRKKYHNILEYLLKLMKNEIGEMLAGKKM